MDDDRFDLELALRGINRAMDIGFDGVHQRLDRLNGRVDRNEDRLNKIDNDTATNSLVIENLTRDEVITKKDAKNIAWAVGLIGSGVACAIKYGPVVIQFLMTVEPTK